MNSGKSVATHSAIDAATVRAYRETEYCVPGELSLVLRVGEANPDLIAAHDQHGVACSAFITAQNPYSLPLGEADNRTRQQMLIDEILESGLDFVDGVGQHPSNDWPGEQSMLVFGLERDAAVALGTRFEQNAIVWSGTTGTPELVSLR